MFFINVVAGIEANLKCGELASMSRGDSHASKLFSIEEGDIAVSVEMVVVRGRSVPDADINSS